MYSLIKPRAVCEGTLAELVSKSNARTGTALVLDNIVGNAVFEAETVRGEAIPKRVEVRLVYAVSGEEIYRHQFNPVIVEHCGKISTAIAIGYDYVNELEIGVKLKEGYNKDAVLRLEIGVVVR